MEKIRVATMFSGYDSQCLALERLGIPYELVCWSEIDKYAIQAHNALFPQYADRNLGDICKIDWCNVPDFDLFTYSSPCQDFSSAGLQRGGEKGSGTRSSLLWECEKAIRIKRPKYLLLENVAALVSGKFIKLFNQWQRTLESYGYRNFAQVLNAKDYGVPQNRERVFLVSILDPRARFYFPKEKKLEKRLADILEKDVPEKYYINNVELERVRNESFAQEKARLQTNDVVGTLLARDYKDPKLVCAGVLSGGVWDSKFDCTRRVYDPDGGLSPTLTAQQGGGISSKIISKEPTIIHKVGDRGNQYYSEKNYAFTLCANPMSDGVQLVKEPNNESKD